ncbi:MAG: Na+/H+ antiporter subunit E [Bacteroidales bacterium]|jgi:multicomponent Na+:H+ antiporter subunit E|nr:Na+/H+ antiporter subunit E [Bacteroidales bacterium]
MSIKNLILSFVVLFATWLLLNYETFDLVNIGIGVVISLVISLIFCNKCDIFSDLKLTPKAMLFSFIYVFVFFAELIKSNFDVARRVLSPSLPINPGIVEVKTKLKSKIGRIILANSITLTPGTLTLEIEDDSLFIHWIDVESEDLENATKQIVQKFEKYLEVIYG